MGTKENIINTKKNKHLSIQERCFIKIKLKEGLSAYKISKSINRKEMVCIKTFYNYIDLGFIKIKNSDLPM